MRTRAGTDVALSSKHTHGDWREQAALPTNADGGPFPIDVGLELDTESRRSETLQVLAALPEWSHKELENAAGASMKDYVSIQTVASLPRSEQRTN